MIDISQLLSVEIDSPFGKTETCARFIIGNVLEQYSFPGVMIKGEEYTLSFYVKSAAAGSFLVSGKTITTTTSWVEHIFTFTASSTDLVFDFEKIGTYNIYHPQLEVGNKASEYSISPIDIEAAIDEAIQNAKTAQETADGNSLQLSHAQSLIQQLSDCIAMLVTDENGESLMTQTANGWSFNLSPISGGLSEATNNIKTLEDGYGGLHNAVGDLQKGLDEVGVLTDYVIVTTYNGQPCIELGESENDFKLRITNTEIQFVEGDSRPAYITNQKLMIKNAEVVESLQFGGFAWEKRANGNVGLVWKGGG